MKIDTQTLHIVVDETEFKRIEITTTLKQGSKVQTEKVDLSRNAR